MQRKGEMHKGISLHSCGEMEVINEKWNFYTSKPPTSAPYQILLHPQHLQHNHCKIVFIYSFQYFPLYFLITLVNNINI